MAVCTPYVTLRNFSLDCFQATGAMSQKAHVLSFVSTVIKLKDYDVFLSAINTWVF